MGKLIVLLFLVAGLMAACGGRSASDLIASANERLINSKPAEAVIELKSALQLLPNSGEARYLLGTALIEQGNPQAAIIELKKAQDLGFDSGMLAPKLARALLASGNAKEVVQSYAGADVVLPSQQAELRTALAMAHLRLGNVAEAEAAVSDALRADPKYPLALLTKARIAATKGHADDAMALANQAVVPGKPSGEAHMLRGFLMRWANKDVDAAVGAYTKATQDPIVSMDAREALIGIYLSREKLTDAKAQLNELKKAYPKSLKVQYLDSFVALAEKDFSRAEAISEQLLRVLPNSPQVLMTSGYASLQVGKLAEAESKLGKVVHTIENVPGARRLLGETYVRMGQYEKALRTLSPLLEQTVPDGDALVLTAQAYLQSGDMQSAESAFAAALKVKPQDVAVRTALALTGLTKGNADAALAELQDIARKDRSEVADLALISARLHRREFDSALAAIESLARKMPGKASTAYLKGIALRSKGDLAGSRAAFENALRLSPGHFASVAALVAMDRQQGRLDAAKDRIESAIKSAPKNIAARMTLVNIRQQQGAKPQELLNLIEDAIAASPSDAAPRVAKIQHLARLPDVKGAALAAQNAMAALPNDPDVLDASGLALLAAGDKQQALSAFNKLARVRPQSALAHLRLGDLHSKQGDLGAAMSSLARAFEAEPRSIEVHARLVSQAVKARDFKIASAAAAKLQKLFPGSATGYLLEGDVERARKSWPRALAAYRAASLKTDSDGRPPRMVYLALRESGDAPGAVRFASDWTASNPRDVAFTRFVAGQAMLRRDFTIAERFYRIVLGVDPKSMEAMNNIAWLMAERGAVGAVDMAERALALSPSAPALMDTLSKALVAEGRFDRALEVQRKVIAADPGRALYRLNMARLYLKAGKRAEAKIELDELSKRGEQNDLSAISAEVAELRKQVGR